MFNVNRLGDSFIGKSFRFTFGRKARMFFGNFLIQIQMSVAGVLDCFRFDRDHDDFFSGTSLVRVGDGVELLEMTMFCCCDSSSVGW